MNIRTVGRATACMHAKLFPRCAQQHQTAPRSQLPPRHLKREPLHVLYWQYCAVDILPCQGCLAPAPALAQGRPGLTRRSRLAQPTIPFTSLGAPTATAVTSTNTTTTTTTGAAAVTTSARISR